MPKTLYFYPAFMAGLLLGSASAWGEPPSARPLNDTGLTWSGTGTTGNSSTCDSGHPAHPAGQDCHYGRDAAALANTLTKTGASALNNGQANGFDFTKISNAGNELAAAATLGSDPDDWACTRDNVTGLTWEVKVKNPSHLRHSGHQYSWYNPDTATNGGFAGDADKYFDGTGMMVSNASLCSGLTKCNMQAYAVAVNTQKLCGFEDWRIPTAEELEGLIDHGRTNTSQPMIDPEYFPNTATVSGFQYLTTTSASAAGPGFVWFVNFASGTVYYSYGVYPGPVYLVRGMP